METTKKFGGVVVLVVAAIMCLALAMAAPAQAYAKGNPYPDVVSGKTVDKTSYKSIKFCKSKGAYKGIIAGTTYKKVKGKKNLYKKVTGKFCPNKKVTQKEFLTMLGNLYGAAKVPIDYNDIKNANKVVTGKYVCNKMVKVAKNLGVSMKWKASNTKLTRAGVANYVYVFANYKPALMPK